MIINCHIANLMFRHIQKYLPTGKHIDPKKITQCFNYNKQTLPTIDSPNGKNSMNSIYITSDYYPEFYEQDEHSKETKVQYSKETNVQ